ncbi:hypothetical protein AVEN_49475-1, partial [Araneus ventricosus]
ISVDEEMEDDWFIEERYFDLLDVGREDSEEEINQSYSNTLRCLIIPRSSRKHISLHKKLL